MTHFSLGEEVMVRYGKHQGQMAKFLKCLPANDYKVKVVDGSVCFYTGKGLKTHQGTRPTIDLR
jgi:hypothetical protein